MLFQYSYCFFLFNPTFNTPPQRQSLQERPPPGFPVDAARPIWPSPPGNGQFHRGKGTSRVPIRRGGERRARTPTVQFASPPAARVIGRDARAGAGVIGAMVLGALRASAATFNAVVSGLAFEAPSEPSTANRGSGRSIGAFTPTLRTSAGRSWAALACPLRSRRSPRSQGRFSPGLVRIVQKGNMGGPEPKARPLHRSTRGEITDCLQNARWEAVVRVNCPKPAPVSPPLTRAPALQLSWAQ
jgi:hypothetical protein